MTLDEFRHEMDAFWTYANEQGDALRDHFVTLQRLMKLYRKFDAAEQKMADEVIAEWVSSGSPTKRYDARALIHEFKIRSAIPALRNQTRQLAPMAGPVAKSER